MRVLQVQLSAGSIKAAEIDTFLKGGGALDIASVRKKPKDWIPDSVWLSIIALSQMDSFRDLPDSVFRNDGLWKQWCARARCVWCCAVRRSAWRRHANVARPCSATALSFCSSCLVAHVMRTSRHI